MNSNRTKKPPLKEKTLQEVREGLLRDAADPSTPRAAAQLYRDLAELIANSGRRVA